MEPLTRIRLLATAAGVAVWLALATWVLRIPGETVFDFGAVGYWVLAAVIPMPVSWIVELAVLLLGSRIARITHRPKFHRIGCLWIVL